MLNSINVKYWELAHSSGSLGSHKSNDYSARCDVCGDSHKKKSSKRLHLYTKSSYDGDHVKCFNGECSQNSSVYTYLKNYHPALLQGYVSEMGIKSLNSLGSTSALSVPVLTIREVHKKNKLRHIPRPKELLQPNKKVIDYLKSRGFTKEIILEQYAKGFKVFLSPGMVELPDKEDTKTVNLENYIVIPLLENGEWYGFYSRNITTKTFHTFIPKENTGYKLWNWFNINKKDTVYIFEAIFNAMSTSLQSIACLGSDIDSERLTELSKPIFCFDNDETGRLKSKKYAKLGCPVLIYPDEVKEKDINDLLKNGWTVNQIDELIVNNIYTGMLALTKLTLQE